jgi:hypothetical protein
VGRKVNVVGCPRTATKGIAMLARWLGVRSIHEGNGTYKFTHSRHYAFHRTDYSLDPLPKWTATWIKIMEEEGYHDVYYDEDNYLHSAWGRSFVMYALSKRYPFLDFIISFRGIGDVANSWHFKECLRKGQVTPKYDVNDGYAVAWLNIYKWLVTQAQQMDRKPYLLDFERYIRGEYLEWFCNLFEVDYDSSVMEFFKRKINGCGDYTKLPINLEYREEAKQVEANLRRVCREVQ